MKKNFMTTLVLASVLVLLVLWYAFYEKDFKIKRNEAKENSKLFIALSKDDIQEVTLEKLAKPENKESSAYQTISLKKTDSDWHLTVPLEYPADASAVSSLLGTLTSSKQERVVNEEPQSLEPYGLDRPLFKVKLRKDSNSAFEEIWVGKDTPVGYSLYIANKNGKPVYRASRSLKNALDKKVKDLRDKSVFKMKAAEVSEIELKHRGKKEVLLKKAQGKDTWDLARQNIPANKDKVTKTLDEIMGLQAVDFIDNAKSLAKYKLSPPSAVAKLQTKEKKRLSIAFGKAGEKIYAKREDQNTLFEVDKKIWDVLNKTAKDYRSLDLAQFNRFKIKRIKLERGKNSIELLKENKEWSLPTEPGTAVDGNKVDSLLAKLQDTKITNYVPSRRSKIESPQLIIRLNEEEGSAEKEKVVLRFGGKQRQQILAERNGLSVPFLIQWNDFEALNLKKAAFIKQPEKKTESKPANNAKEAKKG